MFLSLAGLMPAHDSFWDQVLRLPWFNPAPVFPASSPAIVPNTYPGQPLSSYSMSSSSTSAMPLPTPLQGDPSPYSSTTAPSCLLESLTRMPIRSQPDMSLPGSHTPPPVGIRHRALKATSASPRARLGVPSI